MDTLGNSRFSILNPGKVKHQGFVVEGSFHLTASVRPLEAFTVYMKHCGYPSSFLFLMSIPC